MLLERHSPATIATAIEKHGVWVYDRYNRLIQASPQSNDPYSQTAALDLIAAWQAELNDPEPTFSWDHPKYELEVHPTQLFGWPESRLPNFSAHPKTVNPQNTNTPKTTWTKAEWVKEAQNEANVILQNERKKGGDPKQDALSKDVMKALKNKGVLSARGVITWQNIKREALAGDWWRNSRLRPTI
jgi:hypothetical protein